MLEKKQSWIDSLLVYRDIRMVRILLLGAISGFPWVLIGSSLSLWLKEEGLSRSTIGWAGLIFGVYAINYLWAPIIDRIQIPILTLTGLNFVTAISGAATSISNVGPGLGDIIGPNGNFSQLPNFSKWILSLGMILGRLELFAILVLFLPSFWQK